MFYGLFLAMVHQLRRLEQSHFLGSPTASSNLKTHFQHGTKLKKHYTLEKHQENLNLGNSREYVALREIFLEPIKCQFCPHIETSPLICTANQLTGFYIRATLALNGLNTTDNG